MSWSKFKVKCKKDSVQWSNPPVIAPPTTNAQGVPAFSQVAVVGTQLFVAGQRARTLPVPPGAIPLDFTERVRQTYRNMKLAAEYMGSDLSQCLRIVVYLAGINDADPQRDAKFIEMREVCNNVQNEAEFWGNGNKPPRTILGVSWLNQQGTPALGNDPRQVEVEGTFYLPKKECVVVQRCGC